MPDFDQERYTTAMLALGYARGLISRMRDMCDPGLYQQLHLDIAWLDERITRVMQLNDEAESTCSSSTPKRKPSEP